MTIRFQTFWGRPDLTWTIGRKRLRVDLTSEEDYHDHEQVFDSKPVLRQLAGYYQACRLVYSSELMSRR